MHVLPGTLQTCTCCGCQLSACARSNPNRLLACVGPCADPCFSKTCPSTSCKDATCSLGVCGFKNKPKGTACTEQGLAGTCTGDGKCDTCVSTCKSANACESAYCNPGGECKRDPKNKGMACNNGGFCKDKSCAPPGESQHSGWAPQLEQPC